MSNNTPECAHESIQTWCFEDSREAAGLWSCVACGARFEPVSRQDAAVADAVQRCAELLEANAEACREGVYRDILMSNASAIRAAYGAPPAAAIRATPTDTEGKTT